MARKRVTALTPGDVEFIRELAREVLSRAAEGASTRGDPDDHPAPDVYIALTPPEGIGDLFVDSGTGTGVGVDTGTGADEAVELDYADCDVYRIVTSDTAYGHRAELVAAGFTRRVYNLMPIAVAGSVYVVITRDKFGKWVIPWPGFSFTTC